MDELFSILEILLKYESEKSLSASHDVIYLTGPEPDKLDPEDLKKLKALHCFYDESIQSWTTYT